MAGTSTSRETTPRETEAEAASNGTRSRATDAKPNENRPGLVDAATSIAGRFESTAAEKAESAVGGRGFATLLGWAAENVIAVTRIGSDLADLAVRNLRLAGRKDLARLGEQQARTEDKLERLLQEVEHLEAEIRRSRRSGSSRGGWSGRFGRFGGNVAVSALGTLAALPRAVTEFSNILLTTADRQIGTTPRDVVWTHRKVTLYRYRSTTRRHEIPVLLVFALINRPEIFDLAPGNSFVEFLLEQGYDVFLIDWGVPNDEDADMGIDTYVCDELNSGIRETLRASGAPQVSLLGWCIGATLSAMYVALMRGGQLPALPTPAQSADEPLDEVRNLVVLTMPVDPSDSLYTRWVGGSEVDVDYIADRMPTVPGRTIDWANKTMKPVTNWWGTYRQLFTQVLQGSAKRDAFQPMSKWVGDNPPFPSTAFRQWVTWMYKENRLVKGTLSLRGERVDLTRIDVPLLVVTAGADHIAPRHTTMPLLDLVASTDVAHLDRPGGHIGLMAGSKARKEIWPDIAAWLADRSEPSRPPAGATPRPPGAATSTRPSPSQEFS